MKTLLHAFLRRFAVPGLCIAALAWAATAGAQSLGEAAKKEGKGGIYGALAYSIMGRI